jgi:C1A family cysteine protease
MDKPDSLPAEVPTIPALEVHAGSRPKTMGKGWKRSRPGVEHSSARAHFGAPSNLPAEATALLAHLREIRDQEDTSACTAFATCYAVETRLRLMGYEPPSISRRALYTASGMLEASPPKDDGRDPTDVAVAISTAGLVAEDRWPWDVAKVVAPLPWDVQQVASAFRVSNHWRINSQGASRAEEVAHALSLGYPVIFGTQVGQAFEDYAPTRGSLQAAVLPASNADSLGGHMLCLLGYTTVNGQRLFRGVNSWGTSWGDSGLFWMADSSVAADDALISDFFVFEVVGA